MGARDFYLFGSWFHWRIPVSGAEANLLRAPLILLLVALRRHVFQVETLKGSKWNWCSEVKMRCQRVPLKRWRLWFKENSEPYKDEVLPDAPEELVVELSKRYIQLYEMITSQEFKAEPGDVKERIEHNLKGKGYMWWDRELISQTTISNICDFSLPVCVTWIFSNFRDMKFP